MNTPYVIHTQQIENYGSHAEDGSFKTGNPYWKMKGGNTYVVLDCNRPATAMAFVMETQSINDDYYKEFPIRSEDFDTWAQKINDQHEDDVALDLKYVMVISPRFYGKTECIRKITSNGTLILARPKEEGFEDLFRDGPKFEHDCLECIFLAHEDGKDHYYCPENGGRFVYRCSDDPADYQSARLEFALHDPAFSRTLQLANDNGAVNIFVNQD